MTNDEMITKLITFTAKIPPHHGKINIQHMHHDDAIHSMYMYMQVLFLSELLLMLVKIALKIAGLPVRAI